MDTSSTGEYDNQSSRNYMLSNEIFHKKHICKSSGWGLSRGHYINLYHHRLKMLGMEEGKGYKNDVGTCICYYIDTIRECGIYKQEESNTRLLVLPESSDVEAGGAEVVQNMLKG